jgi:hypothetical protein
VQRENGVDLTGSSAEEPEEAGIEVTQASSCREDCARLYQWTGATGQVWELMEMNSRISEVFNKCWDHQIDRIPPR